MRRECEQVRVEIAIHVSFCISSVISGPVHFDTDTLISALRIATTYNYPELRDFAIAGLERASLTAIDRIRLSDEFLLPSWEKPAFTQLCQRPETITPAEAQVLGMDRFVQIARIREAEQRRQLIGSFTESIKKHGLPEESYTGQRAYLLKGTKHAHLVPL
jgi:hypothetical protein